MLHALQTRLSSNNARLWLLNSIFLLSGLLYTMMYVNLPVCLIPGGMHDDGFFILRAISMAGGQWMGAYNQYALIKGAGYPMFLAGISLFRIPAPLAHALVIVFAVWLLSLLTKKICGSRWLSVAVFELTLWNLGPEMSRVVRDSIYAAQFLMCFVSLILALLATGKRRVLLMALSGFCFGWLWITREEGVILLPTFLLIWVYFGFTYVRQLQRKEFLIAFGLFASCASLLPLFTAARNLSRYHKFETVDTQGNFSAAISALESIDQGTERRFMAISREVRDKAYAVSPAFSRLRPFLDEPGAPRVLGWKTAGCSYLAATCGDYGVGWFMWAFRDAASLDGDFADAGKSSSFFRAVRVDIERACQDGRLSCHHSLIPLLPHFVPGETAAFNVSFEALVKLLLFISPPAAQVSPSVGTPDQMNEAAAFTGVNNFVPTAQGFAPIVITNLRFVHWANAIRKLAVRVYEVALPIVVPAGLVAFLAACTLGIVRRSFPLCLLVPAASWATVFIRLFTLALIDATSFPAVSNQYVSVAFPMSCFAALISFYALVYLVREKRTRKEKYSPPPRTFRGVGGTRLTVAPDADSISESMSPAQ